MYEKERSVSKKYMYRFELLSKGKDLETALKNLNEKLKNVYNMSTISSTGFVGEDCVDGTYYYVFQKTRYSSLKSVNQTIDDLNKAKIMFTYEEI